MILASLPICQRGRIYTPPTFWLSLAPVVMVFPSQCVSQIRSGLYVGISANGPQETEEIYYVFDIHVMRHTMQQYATVMIKFPSN